MFSSFSSFSVLVVLSSPSEFQWVFKRALRGFEVSRMLPVSFKGKKFQGCLKGVSRKLQGSLKGVSSNFKGGSRVFESSLEGVSGKF